MKDAKRAADQTWLRVIRDARISGDVRAIRSAHEALGVPADHPAAIEDIEQATSAALERIAEESYQA